METTKITNCYFGTLFVKSINKCFMMTIIEISKYFNLLIILVFIQHLCISVDLTFNTILNTKLLFEIRYFIIIKLILFANVCFIYLKNDICIKYALGLVNIYFSMY